MWDIVWFYPGHCKNSYYTTQTIESISVIKENIQLINIQLFFQLSVEFWSIYISFFIFYGNLIFGINPPTRRWREFFIPKGKVDEKHLSQSEVENIFTDCQVLDGERGWSRVSSRSPTGFSSNCLRSLSSFKRSIFYKDIPFHIGL